MAEAVHNKTAVRSMLSLERAFSDRALQPGFGDADKRGWRDYCDFNARRSEKYFCGQDRGLRQENNASVVA
jgi:hypothetical protein